MFPKVDAAEMLTESREEITKKNSMEHTESVEPKKKKNKKQKIGFRDRKVDTLFNLN